MASTTPGEKSHEILPPPCFNTNATMEMKTKHQFPPCPHSTTQNLTREMFVGDSNKNHTDNHLEG